MHEYGPYVIIVLLGFFCIAEAIALFRCEKKLLKAYRDLSSEKEKNRLLGELNS